MVHEVLPREIIEARLRDHPTWALKDGKLHREIVFKDFVDVFGFMTQVALAAEVIQHHPEWFNAWNKLVIDLTTYDSGGITELDFRLAAAVDRLMAARTER